MIVLIVEDEPDFSRELEAVLNEISDRVRVSIARSRDSAINLLNEEFFDLIILDLKIPTFDGSLDADPLHGHATFATARVVAPGTPILVLTGSSVEEFIPDMLSHQQQIDIWGTGVQNGTIDFLKKYQFDRCPDLLRPKIEAIGTLDMVELNALDCNLSVEENRLLRIFSRQKGGTVCTASKLNGLSGVKVLKLEILDNNGANIYNAVAKLGNFEKIELESEHYDRYISRLEPQFTPRHLATLRYGAKAVGGVFYGLVSDCELNFFRVEENELNTEDVMANLKQGICPWSKDVPHSRISINTIRRRLINDDAHTAVCEEYNLHWAAEFESREVQAKWACIHGDMHGANILVSSAGDVQLIDYGDISDGPVCLDPITLELSFLFHPDVNCGAWPTVEQAKRFIDLDYYLEGCPFPESIRRSREWAIEARAGVREYCAVLYAYLVRNLQYEDTDKGLILVLLEAVIATYDAT